MNIGRHTWIPEGAGENGIKVARQHSEAVRRNGHPVREITVSTPIEVAQFHSRAARLNGLHSLWDNFFADTVSGNGHDAFFRAHGFCRRVNTLAIFVTAQQITRYMKKFIGVATNNSSPLGPRHARRAPRSKQQRLAKCPAYRSAQFACKTSSSTGVLSPCTDTRPIQ